MKRIQPCLWFDHQAEQAAKFYVSIFKNSKLKAITRYGEAASKAAGRPKGSVMTVEFELAGQPFLGLNGGPAFQFSEAISLTVRCKDQSEVDTYWKRLTKGGKESVCGWLKDRFGLSWQIVPTALMKMHASKDRAAAERAMAAMLTMKKLDLPTLKKAFQGR